MLVKRETYGWPAGEPERVDAVREALVDRVLTFLPAPGDIGHPVPNLFFFRHDKPGEPRSALYEPSLSLVIQGSKRVVLGPDALQYDASQFLMSAIDIPTISHVIEAAPERPFLCMMLALDLTMVRTIATEIDGGVKLDGGPSAGIALGTVSSDILDAFLRLVTLCERPQDIPFLSDLLVREIHYRLLASSAGGWLRKVAMSGTHGNRIARVVSWLRDNFARTVRVEELAEMAHMGSSAFHHHFNAFTQMSPLQYQKQIRLHEARRLLLLEPIDAASAALAVGYESATQFNREYRRLFGKPPIQDVAALKEEIHAPFQMRKRR